jgi:hypothetical protein
MSALRGFSMSLPLFTINAVAIDPSNRPDVPIGERHERIAFQVGHLMSLIRAPSSRRR